MNTTKYLLRFIRKYPLQWAVGILLVPLSTAASRLIIAYANEGYVALLTATGGTGMRQVLTLLIAMLSGSITMVVIEYAARYIFDIFVNNTIRDIRQDMYTKLNTGINKDTSKIKNGEVLTKFNMDIPTTVSLISWDIFGVIYPILVGSSYFVALFSANITITLIILGLDVAVIF